MRLVLVLFLGVLLVPAGAAKVVHENTDELPPGCEEIAGDEHITVRGGKNHTTAFPGTTFGFDHHSWDFAACTRLTVTFVNDDPIRHQFMLHGVFPEGFLLLEVDGPGEETGTTILGSRPATLMAHCGVNQHQQKGMKAQVLVAGGVGDLPNVPGISGVPEGPVAHGGASEGEDVPVSVVTAVLGLLTAALVVARRRA